MRTIRSALAKFWLALAIIGPAVVFGDHWPRFRGPNGEGISTLRGVPTQWSESDYEWVVEFDGKGHSSPVIWDERLFLTTAGDDGSRTIHCLQALTGANLWQDTIPLAAGHLHKKNSYAASTPVTDGERVYVSFADEEHYIVSAYTMNGEKRWSRNLGTFVSENGFAVSPMLYRDLLIVPYDRDDLGPSTIFALDVQTGEIRWQPERPFLKASYSTPMVLNLDGQDQLVTLSQAVGLAGLDPLTGRQLWASGELPKRTVASPIFGNGKLIVSCGQAGRGVLMVAVSTDEGHRSKVVGERKQALPYVPTPLIHGEYLYLWTDDGIVCCVDLRGDLSENVWRERIGGNYSSSPILVDGKIYCVSEEGRVAVIDASPTFHGYGTSPLGDETYATPAVANGRLYLRGFHRLVSLKARTDSAAVSE